jgi:hypothetical protein
VTALLAPQIAVAIFATAIALLAPTASSLLAPKIATAIALLGSRG